MQNREKRITLVVDVHYFCQGRMDFIGTNGYLSITHLKAVSPSYGNQSPVLHGESTDWFLYDRRIGLKWFEQIN